jgi:hypothetical protein
MKYEIMYEEADGLEYETVEASSEAEAIKIFEATIGSNDIVDIYEID